MFLQTSNHWNRGQNTLGLFGHDAFTELYLFILFLSPSSGPVYLFKDDTYWKFMFPGSALEDGYPRSSAADWLDCTDSSSSSIRVDSLSALSLPQGRRELRDQWRKRKEKDDTQEKRGDYGNGRLKHKVKQDTSSNIWTQCACQNAALSHTASVIVSIVLILWPNI